MRNVPFIRPIRGMFNLIGKCRSKIAATLLSVSVFDGLGMIGWHANAKQREVFPAAFLPLGMSMNRLMVAVVDDAAHGIWAGGNKDTALSPVEWVEIEMNAY